MVKKPTKTRTTAVTVSALPSKPISGTSIVPDVAYRNETHPSGPGPWVGEPDKFAWTDKATGYPCVVVREDGGNYGAHVGVPGSHPLSGYQAEAVPGEISKGLHRPVSRAEPCDRESLESESICHVSVSGERDALGEAASRDHGDDAWWLGMTFNGPRDFVPGFGDGELAAERGETYRDAQFAFEQATHLARRLYNWAQFGTPQTFALGSEHTGGAQ